MELACRNMGCLLYGISNQGIRRGDAASLCLHFEGKRHAGTPVCGDLPPKRNVIRMHWNACIGRLKQARKFPGGTVEATPDCPCCWPRASAGTRDPGNQSGLRSFAPSFDLANHRL